MVIKCKSPDQTWQTLSDFIGFKNNLFLFRMSLDDVKTEFDRTFEAGSVRVSVLLSTPHKSLHLKPNLKKDVLEIDSFDSGELKR